MGRLRPEARRKYEKELLATMDIAKSNVLSYMLIEKIAHKFNKKPTLFMTTLISFLLAVLVFLISLSVDFIFGKPISLDQIIGLAISAFLAGAFIWVLKVAEDIAFLGNMKDILALPAEEDGFQKLNDWFREIFRFKPQFIWALSFGICSVISAWFLFRGFHRLASSFGIYIGVFIVFFIIGIGAHAALSLPSLVKVASKTRLNLYAFDPVKSRAVKIANKAYGLITLGTGFVATVVMMMLFILNPWGEQRTFWIAAGWLVIVWGVTLYSFIYPHYYVTQGILFEKQNQLEILDQQIEKLSERLASLSPDEISRLEKYIELREKVFLSKNTSIDISSFWNFITSMVLPAVSFVLGGLDVIKQAFPELFI